MAIYVATIFVKPGHEEQVTRYYQDMEPMLRQARGFRQRQILRAVPGTMAAEVRRQMTPEQLAAHPDRGGHGDGTQFILIEHWDSPADRMVFARTLQKDRAEALFPHLMPNHTHEFYEDISPQQA